MEISDYIAIVSIVITAIIAIVGGVYAVATNTKKFELEEAYKKEMLDWYSKTISIMTSIISKVNKKDLDYEKQIAQLSAQIEIGRFYFPNVDKKDNFGKDKPSAYQGYRHIVLDFLVYFYDVANRDDVKRHRHILWEFMRVYTSSVFNIIAPNERIKKIKKYSTFVMDTDISLDDILEDRGVFRKFY